MIIPDFEITQFGGINTAVKDTKTLKPGVSPDSLNWITSKERDSIELRRGSAALGTNVVEGNGKVTGLGVGTRYDGTQVPWFSYGRKVKYYDAATDTVVEVGSDMLPVTSDSEDVWFEPYSNLAGSFMLLGSRNSGIYKIPTANPGSAVDQSVNSYRFGVFHMSRGRATAGRRNGTTAGNRDDTGFYLSYIDKDQLSDYTQVTGEAYGTGDGVQTTFAATLAQRTGARTVMYVSVTDGVETFIDDRCGNMVGSLGGTGTVNYATGAVSVTFTTAPANSAAITCSYYHETATSGGFLDFSGGGAGQGRVYRQDDGGGNLMAIFNFGTIEYCLHQLKTWQYTGSLDDTTSTNLPYRNVGIPYERAAHPAPEGILFADLSRPADPKMRRLEILQGTDGNTIEPISISDSLDLSMHDFSTAVVYRWGDYEILCVQKRTNEVADGYNSVMYVRNVVSGIWDRLSYYASCLGTYEGTLIAGDSISNNLYTLFSGYDDDGSVIENYWTTGNTNLGTERLKTVRRMVLAGLIQPDQAIDVSLSYDNGPYTKVFTIDGSGDYVDNGVEISIGSPTVGSSVIGGGSSTASPYEVDFKVNSDRFKNVRVKLEATSIGYASVAKISFKDIRDKGQKNLPVRTT